MKITALRAVLIYNALVKLKGVRICSFTKYRNIRHLINAFDEEFSIYAEKEQDLIKRYVKHDSSGTPVIKNGQPIFAGIADEVRYAKEKIEMNDEVIEFDIKSLELTEDEVEQIGLTYGDIEILEGVVDIKWKEEDSDAVPKHNPS